MDLELRIRLNRIAELTPGSTLNSRTGEVMLPSRRTSLARTWYRDDRHQTFQLIEQTIFEAIRMLSSEMEYLPRIRKCRSGLHALKITYETDTEYIDQITRLDNYLQREIYRFEAWLIDRIHRETANSYLPNHREIESCNIYQTPIGTPFRPFRSPLQKTPLWSSQTTPQSTPIRSPSDGSNRSRSPIDPLTPPSSPRGDRYRLGIPFLLGKYSVPGVSRFHYPLPKPVTGIQSSMLWIPATHIEDID